MKNIILTSLCIFILGVVLSFFSCDKFLDTKPDQKLAVPESLDDLQALLDDHLTLIIESIAGEISSDDYIMSDADLFSLSNDFHRRMYIWDSKNLFIESDASNDWGRYYRSIYYCNAVLERLDKIEKTDSNKEKYNDLKGRALFLRAHKLFNASLIWCSVYDSNTAKDELGMPIKLDTDFNKRSVRASLEETYLQIIKDAENALLLLSEYVSHSIEPSLGAAYALLARVNLYMGNYEEAYSYSDLALSMKSDLIDYNILDEKESYPIPQFNKETLYYIQIASQQILSLDRAKIVKTIFDSYDINDLRREIYFTKTIDGSYLFKGRYTGSASLFLGYATDELYLIRSESAARTEKIEVALKDLNDLLVTRWRKINGISTYHSINEKNPTKLLDKILLERRKSLIFRGLRWYDLKRLNRDGANIALKRTVDGIDYILPPNDLRYALPIPEDIVKLSDIVQNPR